MPGNPPGGDLEASQVEAEWTGVFHGWSGYAKANRSILSRAAVFARIHIADDAPWDPKEPDPSIQNLYNFHRSLKVSSKAPRIRFWLPQAEVQPGYRVIFTMSESDRVHPGMVALMNERYNEAWVPTKFNAQTFARSGLNIPIYVMPLGVDTGIYTPSAQPMLPKMVLMTGKDAGRVELPKGFLFISVFEPSFRKGYDVLIKTFEETFKNDPEAGLILGTTAYSMPPNEFPWKEMKSRVWKLQGAYSEKNLASIFKACKVYVTATRAEGWNLPIYEAAAVGLPVIVPRTSVHPELVPDGMGYFFDKDGDRVFPDGKATHPWHVGVEFPDYGQKSQGQLSDLMRRAKKNYAEAQAQAQKLCAHVVGKFTWGMAALKVAERIRAICGGIKQPAARWPVPVAHPDPSASLIDSGQIILPQQGAANAKRLFRSTNLITVKWASVFLDGSGYAEAGRNYVAALSTVGVNVVAQNISFEDARADYGLAGKYSTEALARKGDYAVKIISLTPENFPLHKEVGCYNIGFFAWETDVLPVEWVEACNGMNEIWVPASWTAEVARKSGVVRPIHVFGHCSAPEDYVDGPVLGFPGLDPSWYKFYSIFQWTERKNPKGLLKAYLTAFTDKDPVALILKTYRSNYSDSEESKVMAEIEEIRRDVGGKRQPRVLVIPDMLSRAQILALHRLGDCFSLIHRSEGFGLPHFEACMMGKPVITTNYSANLEFTKPNNSYLVNHGMVPVGNMPWIKWYRDNMVWADPDVNHCRTLMRHVYTNQTEARKKGLLAREHVKKNFSWQAIGNKIKARLSEIMRRL